MQRFLQEAEEEEEEGRLQAVTTQLAWQREATGSCWGKPRVPAGGSHGFLLGEATGSCWGKRVPSLGERGCACRDNFINMGPLLQEEEERRRDVTAQLDRAEMELARAHEVRER